MWHCDVTLCDLTWPLIPSSNVFGGEDQSTANQKKNNYNRSDIFNLGGAPQTPPQSVGKKAYNKKDNDIFGIRERATGEVRESFSI